MIYWRLLAGIPMFTGQGLPLASVDVLPLAYPLGLTYVTWVSVKDRLFGDSAITVMAVMVYL